MPRVDRVLEDVDLWGEDDAVAASAPPPYPEPEDRGLARRSELGLLQYVEDLVRPGRIIVCAAEEGTGKSFAISGELAIRLACAGGSFAETWPIVERGNVLLLSEMHSDDDFEREEIILESVGLPRSSLEGRLFRLDLMTAANGEPVLADAGWRAFCLGWCQEHQVKTLIFDTGTGATQVDPWGPTMQAVFRNLRLMLSVYPELAIIIVVHCKKPTGKGARAISDVIGEWGRWCDVVLLFERNGADSVRLSTLKRVHQQRVIVASQRDGLLRDVREVHAGGQKVPLKDVVETIRVNPGISIADLALALEVGKATAARYVASAIREGLVNQVHDGPRRTARLFVEVAATC